MFEPYYSQRVQCLRLFLHCALSLAAQCFVIGPVCGRVCNRRAGGRAGGRCVFVYVFACLFVGLLPRSLEIACIDLHQMGL